MHASTAFVMNSRDALRASSHNASMLSVSDHRFLSSLSPPIDSIRDVMTVWWLGGKIIRTVLCCVVYDGRAQ